MLGFYRSDLYFDYKHDYELAIEIDEYGHSNSNIDYKIENTKINGIRTWFGCEFIVTDPKKKKILIFLKLSMKYLGISNNKIT